MAAGGAGRAPLIRAAALVLLLVGCSGGIADESMRTATTTVDATLEDGTYFGFVVALDPAEFHLTFDAAELLEGEDAAAAAEEDGGVVTAQGRYVRNAEVESSRVTLDEDIAVRLLVPCCELQPVAFQDWLAGFEPDDRTFYGTAASHYELTVTDGRATAVDEVYIP